MITLLRCDDRIIHGQVITSWMKTRQSDGVIIVDDKLALDKSLGDIYKAAVPLGKVCVIFSQEQAKSKIPEAIKSQKKYFLITRNILEMNKLFENHLIEPTEIICGPASERLNTKTYSRNFSLTDQEVEAGNNLVKNDFDVKIQFLSDSSPKKWQEIVGD